MASRVLIVDDHDSYRSQASILLKAFGYEVVGEAADAASAIQAIRDLEPDVVLLDVQLPDRDGFSVADELAAEPGAPRIVLISSREAADYGSRIGESAVAGFIHKSELSRARFEALVGAPV